MEAPQRTAAQFVMMQSSTCDTNPFLALAKMPPPLYGSVSVLYWSQCVCPSAMVKPWTAVGVTVVSPRAMWMQRTAAGPQPA